MTNHLAEVGRGSLRCSLCEEPAVTLVRYAKLRLCRKHFAEFVRRRVIKTIERYRLIKSGWKVLVAVSGGKDSSALLHILSEVSRQLNFDVVAVHIDLGIGEYSRKAREVVEKLCGILGVQLVVLDLKDLIGASLPELVTRSRRPACSVCGLVKRYLINSAALELGANAIALGHHMDDLLPYVVKNFITQDLGGIGKLGPGTESEEGLIGRVRPLYEISEREVALYAYVQGLPVVESSCPYTVRGGSIEEEVRRFLNSLEEGSPGIKIAFARALAKNLDFYKSRLLGQVGRCRYCGTPTSAEVCAFCRLTERGLGKPMGPAVRAKIREIVERGVKGFSKAVKNDRASSHKPGE
jgi:uncharacterized protein (TIGR00269 family)